MPEMKYTKLEILFENAEQGTYRMKMGLLPAGMDAAQRAPVVDVPIDIKKLSALGATIADYARELTSQVFAHEASRTFFANAIMASTLTKSFLRLQLVLTDETPELHSLVWESLCNPASGDFLATSENILLSRYLESQDARLVQLRPKGEIQAAAFVANPANLEDYDLLPVDVAGELGRASQAMGGMLKWQFPGKGKFATLQNLLSASRQGADVLYLACHGAVLKTKGPVLYLETDDGRSSPVTGTDVVKQLTELKELPRLIVLASCESAGVERAGALSALGPSLAAAGVPAVLAMHGKISMETVKQFMPVFFSEMLRDGQIDRALGVARAAVRGHSDAWMPVLFMRSVSGRLWLEADETGPTSAQMETLINEVKTLKDQPANALNIQGEGISISGGVNIGGTVAARQEAPVPVAAAQPAEDEHPFQLDLSKILASRSTLSPVEIKGMPRKFFHLKEFIGRANEFEQFASTVINPIQERSKSIITFYGQTGIGKSWLLDRIEFECVRQQIPFSRVNFESGSSNNRIEILREIVRELGEGLFRPWVEVDRYWHSPKIDMNISTDGAPSNVSANLSAQNANISGGVVVGTNVNVSGSFAANTPAANQPDAAIQTLTDTFIKVLGDFVKARPVVLLFEGVDHELCSNETRKWLVNTFLVRARELSGFGVLPVFTYQDRPQFERSIESDTLETKLAPLNRGDIIEYFERRGIPAGIVEQAAEACLNETQGIPARVYEHSELLMHTLDEALAEAGVPAQPNAEKVEVAAPVVDLTPVQVDSEPLPQPEPEPESEPGLVAVAPPDQLELEPEPAFEGEPGLVAVVPSEQPEPAPVESQIEALEAPLAEPGAILAFDASQPPQEKVPEDGPQLDKIRTMQTFSRKQIAEAMAASTRQQSVESESAPPPKVVDQAPEPVSVASPKEADQAPEPESAPMSRVFSADEVQSALAYQRSQEKLQKLKSEGKGSMGAMVEARLSHHTAEVDDTARRASVLRWFNPETLAVLLDTPLSENTLDEMIEWPFVQSQSHGQFVFRQDVRQYLYNSLLQDNAGLVRELHQRAHDFFHARLEGLDEEDEMLWALLSAEQTAALREMLYHRLRVDTGRGFALLEELFQSAQRSRLYGETATLIQFAKEFAQPGLAAEYQNLILYWEALQATFEGEREAAQAKITELSRLNLTPKLSARVTGYQGLLFYSQRNINGAIKSFENAQKAFQKLKMERESARVGVNLGNAYLAKGDAGRAEKTYNMSLFSFRKGDNLADQAQALNNLGNAFQQQERWDKAVEAYQQSLKIKLGISDQFGAATSYINFAGVYQRKAVNANNKQQPELRQKAEEYYLEGIRIFREMGSRPDLAPSLYKLAYFYHEIGERDKAGMIFSEAIPLLEEFKLIEELKSAEKLNG